MCAGRGFIKPWFVEREFLAYFQAFDRVFQAKLNAKKRFISFVLQLKVRAASTYGVRGDIARSDLDECLGTKLACSNKPLLRLGLPFGSFPP